jgi:hypothetical protein
MNRFQFLIVTAAALVAGLIGGILGGGLSREQVVLAAPREQGIKVALLDLVKCSRASKKYTDLKLNFDDRVTTLKNKMEAKKAQMEKLEKELDQLKRRAADAEEIQKKEIEIKTLDEEVKVTKEYYDRMLVDLSNDFQKEVLEFVYVKAKEYCKTRGYDLMLQQYDLDTKTDDSLQASRAWADTLKNMPVLFYAKDEPNKPDPNIYVQDITEEIIRQVK